MTAASPKAYPPAASDSPRPQEPSMEEILASIRRIIADDQRLASNVAASFTQDIAPPLAESGQSTAFEPPAKAADDGRSATFAGESLAAQRPLRPQSDLSRDLQRLSSGQISAGPASLAEPPSAESHATPVAQEATEAQEEAVDESEPPMTFNTNHASREAAAQPQAMQRNGSDRLISPTTDASVANAFDTLSTTLLSSHPRTLEDLVGDLLRPMLQSWLDENLPEIVERLVRVEIERLARGKRV